MMELIFNVLKQCLQGVKHQEILLDFEQPSDGGYYGSS